MRLPTIPVLCLLALPAAADTATLEAAMILGPLPVAPATTDSPRVHAAVKLVPEIDPAGWLPGPEETVKIGPDQVIEWRHENADSSEFHLEGPGVWWLAARLSNDRWDELTFTAPEGAAIFVDGEAIDGELVDIPLSPLDPAYDQVVFDHSYACTPNLAATVPPN